MSGRGRRDNGLDAPLWSPLRDVDPRVGEHLLDVLYDAGIAAYLEPAADVGPYTRTVFLPSPPTDRLYVDRARRAEARTLVEAQADEHIRPVPERARLRRDLDEDAEWARIVAAFEAEHGHLTVEDVATDAPPPAPPSPRPPPSTPPPPSSPPPPPVEEPDLLDQPEEHFEPPPAPPVPVPKPSTLYSFLLVAVGLVLVWAPSVIGLSSDAGLVLGVAAVAAGVGTAVRRMRERSTDDGDDGAVV